MAINTDFNIGNGVKAARRLLRTYVNVGSEMSKEWFLVGSGVEDSSIDLNPNIESATDILGVTTTDVTKWEPSQTFDPFTVKGGSKLAFKLHEIWLNKTPELLSKFEVLIVYKYIGTETDGYEAELQKNCTINPTSIGGSAYVDMPIEIIYSNDSRKGTVKFAEGEPVFSGEKIDEPAIKIPSETVITFKNSITWDDNFSTNITFRDYEENEYASISFVNLSSDSIRGLYFDSKKVTNENGTFITNDDRTITVTSEATIDEEFYNFLIENSDFS